MQHTIFFQTLLKCMYSNYFFDSVESHGIPMKLLLLFVSLIVRSIIFFCSYDPYHWDRE